jgi:hypothetical protein
MTTPSRLYQGHVSGLGLTPNPDFDLPYYYRILWYMPDNSKRDIKVQLITEINNTLLLHNKPAITPKDFDRLYDLTVKELVSVKRTLIRELFEYPSGTIGLP